MNENEYNNFCIYIVGYVLYTSSMTKSYIWVGTNITKSQYELKVRQIFGSPNQHIKK